MLPDDSHSPIAVFDSGLGGLTVARAIRQALPNESIVYFGDTARLPYGSKSAPTVLRFARQCLRFLMQLQPKLLVVACNTVSATALETLADEFPVPVLGVLQPGARAAVTLARSIAPGGPCRIGLIATEATIASNAYPTAIAHMDHRVHVVGRPCPLLVPLIEEGRSADSPIVRAVLEDYLASFTGLNITAMILGCTHYPIFASAIADVLGPRTQLVDAARQTALEAHGVLDGLRQLRPPGKRGKFTCYVTDQGLRFERLASLFLGHEIGQPTAVAAEMLEAAMVEQA